MEKNKTSIASIFKNTFVSTSILNKLTLYERKAVKRSMVDDISWKLVLVGFIVLFVQIYYMINDILNGFYQNNISTGGYINLCMQLILLISSITIILIKLVIKKTLSIKAESLINNVYYYIIIIAVTFFMYTDYLRNPLDTSMSVFYLVIFAFAPIADFYDNIIQFCIIVMAIMIMQFCVNVQIGIIIDVSQLFIATIICFIISNYFQTSLAKQIVSNYRSEELNSKLLVQSSIDALTSALNRYALNTNFYTNKEKWLIDNTRVGVIMFDIDNFKSYNDNYSHIAGDECLQRITSAIRQLCNPNLEHIYRYGGEEFVLFTTNLDPNEILDTCLEIKRTVENLQIARNDISGSKNVTISIGCVDLKISKDLMLSDALLLADKQLYNAKASDKNCVSFNDLIYK